MSGSRQLMALAVAALGFANSASAYTYLFADLQNANEPPPIFLTDGTNPRPASFGFAEFILNDDQTAMTMKVTLNNVDITGAQTPYTQDNLTAAHIHGPTTTALTGTAGVAWGFFGSPQNDINPNDRTVTPFAAPGVGGVFTGKWDALEGNGAHTLTNKIADILAGKMYINFHTSQNGGGELRGFLQLPEPAAMSLLVLPALAMVRRRSR